MVTHHRAHSIAGVGAAMPASAEVSIQTELQMVDAALWVLGCRECLGPLSEAGDMVPFPNGGIVEGTEQSAWNQRGWVRVRVWERGREMDRIFLEILQLQSLEPQLQWREAVCPWQKGKWKLRRRQKLEVGDFWHQEEGSCKACNYETGSLSSKLR